MVKWTSVRAREAEKTSKTKWNLTYETPCTVYVHSLNIALWTSMYLYIDIWIWEPYWYMRCEMWASLGICLVTQLKLLPRWSVCTEKANFPDDILYGKKSSVDSNENSIKRSLIDFPLPNQDTLPINEKRFHLDEGIMEVKRQMASVRHEVFKVNW